MQGQMFVFLFQVWRLSFGIHVWGDLLSLYTVVFKFPTILMSLGVIHIVMCFVGSHSRVQAMKRNGADVHIILVQYSVKTWSNQKAEFSGNIFCYLVESSLNQNSNSLGTKEDI